MTVIVRIIALAGGTGTASSPHEGRWVRYWNPHTRAGVCELETTVNRAEARRFASPDVVMAEWRTVSVVEARRPWDGEPNRPLTGLSIQTQAVFDA